LRAETPALNYVAKKYYSGAAHGGVAKEAIEMVPREMASRTPEMGRRKNRAGPALGRESLAQVAFRHRAKNHSQHIGPRGIPTRMPYPTTPIPRATNTSKALKRMAYGPLH
jgi:hypothetical protein